MTWRLLISDPWELSSEHGSYLFGEGEPEGASLVIRLSPGSTLGDDQCEGREIRFIASLRRL